MGHLMKLLNNLLSTTAMAVTDEAMTVGGVRWTPPAPGVAKPAG